MVPPQFKTLSQLIARNLPSTVANTIGIGSDNIRINVEKSLISGGYQAVLQDGKLKGRIAPIGSKKGDPIRLNEMNVFLIQDDEIYSRATVAENGEFEFLDIEKGVYSFAAVGKDGFAAVSFQAVEKAEGNKEDKKAAAVEKNENKEILTSKRVTRARTKNRFANNLVVAICPANDSVFIRRQIAEVSGDPSAIADLPADLASLPDLPTTPVPTAPPFSGNPFVSSSSPPAFGGGGFGGPPLIGRPGLVRPGLGLLGLGGLAGLAGLDASPDGG